MTAPARGLRPRTQIGSGRLDSPPVVSGMSLAIGALGVLLIVAGVHRSPIADVLKAAIKGQPIPQGLWDQDATLASTRPAGPTLTSATVAADAGGTALGRQVAALAITYVGKVPYVWAGETPTGWDCSGFVTWVLTHSGVTVPDSVHTVTGTYYVWSGATTIPRSACAPGDLVCWPSHIGIAVDNKRMVNAANPHDGTLISNIWTAPAPVIRRPKAYGTTVVAA